jgi:3-hydroxyacyl-CoA dehydrogenase/enoyl-CoA hydratase/3-hydroxybutyryl-CoA epimerase
MPDTPTFQTTNLRIEQRPDGIALLRLDVPGHSINVLNREVLGDLEAAFEHVAAEPTIRLLVIRSDKISGFVAGADLHEFASIRTAEEATAISATGQGVFTQLANLPVPTIGLIHGPCLGGGLELALACDYRILLEHAKTQLGLPEVELGLVPGWGGTQRLPRVVGLERALQIILGGRRLSARDALRIGLAEAVGASESELAARLGILTVQAIQDGKRKRKALPLRTWRQRLLESTPVGRHLVFRGTERMLHARVPDDLPAPWEALKAVRVGLRRGMRAGLAYEQEAAGRLATTSACRNLVNLFLEREEARKLPSGPALDIRRVGLVGAGLMGAGIAQLAAIRGFQVTVQEVNDTALEGGMGRISELFQKAVDNRVLTSEAAEQKCSGIRGTTTWEGFGAMDLVVEAVVEQLPIKQAVFRELEAWVKPESVLATNTSSLLVSQIQEGLKHPERVAGLHFFNPVHKMPLVEVVRTPSSSDRTVAGLVQWAVALGKTPVVVRDSPGFVVNRILMPYLLEAIRLAGQGVAVGVIDQTMRRFGMPMGPLELLDQIGLDVATHAARAMQPTFGQRWGGAEELQRISGIFERMCQEQWLGQKTGLGFYRYTGKTRKVHRAARELLTAPGHDSASLLSHLPAAVQMREARERMVLLMVNESAACLGEQVAADAATIDLAMVLGTGWAPHRGGPLRYARERGLPETLQALEELAKRLGPRFEPCAAIRDQLSSPSHEPGVSTEGRVTQPGDGR